MKNLEELGISKAPWSPIFDADDWKTVYGIQSALDEDEHRDVIVWQDEPMRKADASMMMTSPELYEQLRRSTNMIEHTIQFVKNADIKNTLRKLADENKSALAKAAGEEVADGK